ncbi:MAG: hypothetical protein CMK43_11000 [Porticoccaceae bacterium]|nr:hypothetical protein [Porticoccaceae bacterium]
MCDLALNVVHAMALVGKIILDSLATWPASPHQVKTRHSLLNITRSIRGLLMNSSEAYLIKVRLRSIGDFIFCRLPCSTFYWILGL